MTDKKDVKKFCLYALPVDIGNKIYAEQCKFSRITAQYVLVYTDKKLEDLKHIEIMEDDFYRLSADDRAWLWESVCTIMREMLEENKLESDSKMNDMLDRLEKALESERNAIEGVVKNATTG